MKRKPGMPSKGDRAQFTVRVPREHYEALVECAKAEGLSLSDYLNVVIAKSHDLALPSYVERVSKRQQEELPISA